MLKSNINSVKFDDLRALHDSVLVTEMQFSSRQLSSGILLPNDDATSAGIRPRWARVYAVGPDHTDVQPGQYILVGHGRWTRGVKIHDALGEKVLRKVDPADILLVSNTLPQDDTMSTALIV